MPVSALFAYAPARTIASSGRAARMSIAWLQPRGTTHAGLPSRVALWGQVARPSERQPSYVFRPRLRVGGTTAPPSSAAATS